MLEIKNLSKTYKNGKRAVDNLTLTIEDGDIYGFIGHNGAGKSTTIRSVVGVQEFDAGEILINGHSIQKEPVLCKQQIAYIPDNPDLYEHLSGIQYLNFISDIFGIGKKEREEKIEKYATKLEILRDLGDLIGSYSHGMRQKLAIISALVHEPKLMILDEPFVGLDPQAVVELKNIMHDLCAKGSAVFFSTHVLDVAEKLCNKVAIIKEGRLVAAGDMKTIMQDQSLEDVFLEVAANDK